MTLTQKTVGRFAAFVRFLRAEPESPKAKRWSVVIALLAAMWITGFSLVLALGDYKIYIFGGYFIFPQIFLLNFLPVAGVMMVLWALTGRMALSYGLTSTLFIGGSIINYFKLMFRDDPVVFGDLFIASTGFNAALDYNLAPDLRIIAVLICIIGMGCLIGYAMKGRPDRWLRIVTVAVAAASVMPLWTYVYSSEDIYMNKTKNFWYSNPWTPTQMSVSKGFIYPFIHSITYMTETPPDGYEEEAAEAILARYEDEEIPAERKVNVLAFQLEAYTDFEAMGVEGIDESVYAPYRTIQKESLSGTLLTNIFAGGTVDTERCFVTGYYDLGEFRKDTNSYVWYLKSQGYITSGSHPSYEWFYNRLNINPRLGLDNYKFTENHYTQFTPDTQTYDAQALPEMLRLYQEDAASGDPVFHFNVTYQGHGPYATDNLTWGEVWKPEGAYENVSEYTYNVVNNYLGEIRDTGNHLLDVLDVLREDEVPVVVVLFGDHKPWLGDNNVCYAELGINLDTGTDEGYFNYFATEYVIWANDAAKQCLDGEFCGEGPVTSTCFLMNILFEQLGWQGDSYMQAVNEIRETIQAVSTGGGFVENGSFVRSLSEEGSEALRNLQQIQFYRRNHFVYGTE